MAGSPRKRQRRVEQGLVVAPRSNGTSAHGSDCSCVRCAGFEVTHGATSERQIVRRAAVHKRRFLRQAGLRASDLESVGRAMLLNWSRAAAQLTLLDEFTAEHGIIDAAGNPRGFAGLYTRLLNAERAALRALEGYIRRTQDDAAGDPVDSLYRGLRDG